MNTKLKRSAPDNYPLQVLEELSQMFLSIPEGADIRITPEVFERQLEEETAGLELLIKKQAFALGREKETRLLVQRYQASLTRLLDQALQKSRERENPLPDAEQLLHIYIIGIEKVIAFLGDYFPEHSSSQQQIPASSICRERNALLARLMKIEERILGHPEEMVAGIIFKRLRRFAASTRPIPFKVRYRDLRYKEELLRHLEEIKWGNEKSTLFTPVEQMLIYLNYNSKAFIKLLVRKIFSHIEVHSSISDKLDNLLLFQKAFRQIHPKPGLILNPGYHQLDKVLNGWFDEEIRYLEKKSQLYSLNVHGSKGNEGEKKEEAKLLQKVMVRLSSDQAGLILRAADDLRILVARSLSEVFKTIVPHLSTSNRVDPSYKGMRTQSYVAEERDKDIAIDTLQRMINRIKEY